MPLNQGILNEIELERALNGHRISELNSNLRNFILTLFRPSPAEINHEIIHAERTCNTRFKPDLIITFAGRTLKVSVKSGSGNSVHQEPIRTFVAYLRDQLQAPDAVINDLLFFHWGDGTLDGSGPVSARLPARTIIENYPEKIATVQAFFTEYLDVLLERFLSTGIYNLGSVDWIYYGDRDSGSWQPISAVYATLKQNFSNPLSVGGLNFQTYGRSLNGQDDRRRRDIQLKWGNMAAFFLNHQVSVPDFNSKIKGDNSHGFRNVEEIISAIDQKTLGAVPQSLRNFLIEIFGQALSLEAVICARKVRPGFKGDVLVWQANHPTVQHNFAVASGNGVSIHQEDIDSFCDFLTHDLRLSQATVDAYRRYHFADGTLDGSGPVAARQTGTQYKHENPESLALLAQELTSHGQSILERFVKANQDYPEVEYLLYGDSATPVWAKIATLIENELHKAPNSRAALAIGDVSLQAWNRSLQGQADHKRRAMQAKWNNLEANIIAASTASATPAATIADTNLALQGLDFESSFVAMLNRDKTHPFWRNFATSNENLYFVNVSYHQTSRIAGAKVAPKSDCYVVQVEPDITQFLAEDQYVLTEEILRQQNLNYQTLAHSGISLKMPGATHYTLQKLSYSAFRSLFAELSPAYFVAALLFVNVAELEKNDLIFATFQTNLDALCRELSVDQAETEVETCRRLKAQANAVITEQVNSQAELYQAICFGIGVFEDPYCASYVFAEDVLHTSQTYHPRISVTTGSGRSNGTYNLAFKTAR